MKSEENCYTFTGSKSIRIERVNNEDIRSKIMSIGPRKRKELKINKSTLWHQQKKIKEGKEIKVYGKTREKI